MSSAKKYAGDFIILDKGYFGNGKLIGIISKPVLRRHILKTREIQKLQKISDKEINARVADFSRLLAKITPHWLEEANGLARGAGIALNDLLMLNCLPYNFYQSGGGCTAFLSIGREENRLFKIRDKHNHPQAFYIKHLPNGLGLQIGHDIGNLGFGHCFTNAPLAGANNTGSQVQAKTDDPALDDCHILRFIAERAKKVNDIPILLDKLISQKAVKGAAHGRGAIFLFADSNRGLIIECTGSDFIFKYSDRGTQVRSNHFIMPDAKKWMIKPANPNTLRRRQRMEELLKCRRHPLAIEEIFVLARDRKNQPNSLCNDNNLHFWMTVSAQLQIINRKHPPKSVNYICCGNTRYSVFLPVPITERRSFVPLAGGAFYDASDRLYKMRPRHSQATAVFQDLERSIIRTDNIQSPAEMAYQTLLQA